MKEFFEVILEILNYHDGEALFAFMDCLQSWVRMEIERCGVKDLAIAISIVESLVDFQRRVDWEKSRQPKEKNGANGSHSVYDERSKVHKGKVDFMGEKKGKEKGDIPSIKCFLCEGPHRVRDCLKRNKLFACEG